MSVEGDFFFKICKCDFTFIREVRVMTFLQRSFSTKTFNTPLTYNGVMCSGRHVRQDKLFFNRNVSNVRPNNRQFWRFALKQFFHDLKKFKKELKDNYFSFFEQQTYKKRNEIDRWLYFCIISQFDIFLFPFPTQQDIFICIVFQW